MSNTFICERCKGEFPLGDDAEAEAEAERLFGVKNAASDPTMSVVCDDCHEWLLHAIAAAGLPFKIPPVPEN